MNRERVKIEHINDTVVQFMCSYMYMYFHSKHAIVGTVWQKISLVPRTLPGYEGREGPGYEVSKVNIRWRGLRSGRNSDP